MSNFSEFIQQNEITEEAVMAASYALEHHGQEDRDLKKQRETARREKKTYEELSIAKPSSSGRGISTSTVHRAMAGTKLTRMARGKLTRAVNACLAHQKKDSVDVLGLFGSKAKPKEESSEDAAE
jgi:hypothetical protein